MTGAFWGENKKKLFLMIFGVAILALGFGAIQAPKAEAGHDIYCYTDNSTIPSCQSYDDNCTIGCTSYTGTCTVNTGNSNVWHMSGSANCADGNAKCQTNGCPDSTNLGNGDPCTVNVLDGTNVRSASGKWDLNDQKCVVCLSNNIELSVCGTTSGISLTNSGGAWQCSGPGDGKFESACGADASCDEHNSGFNCGTGKACDTNGKCVSVASCTYNNPTVTLNPFSVTGSKGSTQTFTISVTNNNTVACANETFTLTGTVPGGWSNSISPSNTVTLTSGAVMTRNFNVTSSATVIPGTYNVSVSGTGNLGGKSGIGSGTYVVSAGGYASFKDSSANTWYSLKSDLTKKTCSSVCTGAVPPNSSCSNVGACQTGFGGSDTVCALTYATCTNDRDACNCPTAEICNNGIDDNGNGLIDCADVGFCPTGSVCGTGKTCNAGACVASGGGAIACPSNRDACEAVVPGLALPCNCGTALISTGESKYCCGATSGIFSGDATGLAACNTACGVSGGGGGSAVCNNNGVQDNGETGIDCGGGGCPACVVPPPASTCGGPGLYRSPISYCTVQDLLTAATTWILGLVSSIIILILVIGGLMYVTSTGDEERLRQAKNIILYAVIGLGIILISYSLIVEVKSILQVP